jgi:hypothetical protein
MSKPATLPIMASPCQAAVRTGAMSLLPLLQCLHVRRPDMQVQRHQPAPTTSNGTVFEGPALLREFRPPDPLPHKLVQVSTTPPQFATLQGTLLLFASHAKHFSPGLARSNPE